VELERFKLRMRLFLQWSFLPGLTNGRMHKTFFPLKPKPLKWKQVFDLCSFFLFRRLRLFFPPKGTDTSSCFVVFFLLGRRKMVRPRSVVSFCFLSDEDCY